MESGRATLAGYALHFAQQFIDVALIGRIGPGVPRRVDARPPIECIDHEAGVVRDRGQARHQRRMPRLDQRVFHEAIPGLVRSVDTEFVLRDDLHACIAEDALNLPNLARVTRGKDDLSGHGHAVSRRRRPAPRPAWQ